MWCAIVVVTRAKRGAARFVDVIKDRPRSVADDATIRKPRGGGGREGKVNMRAVHPTTLGQGRGRRGRRRVVFKAVCASGEFAVCITAR